MRNGRRGVIGEANLHLLGRLYEAQRHEGFSTADPAVMGWEPPAFPMSEAAWAYMQVRHAITGEYEIHDPEFAQGLRPSAGGD